MTDSGPAIPLAVSVTASDHGGGRFSPLSASGMGRAAGEPGVSCGRVWGWLLSPSLLLSLSVAAVTPLSVGSAASPFPPVVTWSGHSVG